jgi:hypothetical protein
VQHFRLLAQLCAALALSKIQVKVVSVRRIAPRPEDGREVLASGGAMIGFLGLELDRGQIAYLIVLAVMLFAVFLLKAKHTGAGVRGLVVAVAGVGGFMCALWGVPNSRAIEKP